MDAKAHHYGSGAHSHDESRSATRVHSHARRRWMIVLLSIIAFFAILHWGGGAIATTIINHKLSKMESFTGHVGAVKLALWHGAVGVDNFELRDRDKPQEPPVVRVGHASLSLAFGPLFHGKLGGEGKVEDVDLIFAKHVEFSGPSEAAQKAGEKAQQTKEKVKDWHEVLQNTMPIEISRFEMKNGHVRYIDRAHQPNADVELHNLNMVVTGLQNRPQSSSASDSLPAKLELNGQTTKTGQLHVLVSADPAAEQPRFNVTFQLRDLNLPEMNTFMRAYAGADVSRGTFEMYSEIKADNGGYNGYVKPFFHDLDFRNYTDKDKSFGERAKEKVVSAAASLLKSNEDKKVATVTPFSGTFSGAKVGVWETVHNLLRNAFVQALREGFQSQKPSG